MTDPVEETDIAVRIHSSQGDGLEQAVRDAFPGVEVFRGPMESDRPEKVLVTFDPPEDEDLSKYGWVHCVGAGVDAICKAFAGIEPAPLVTRTTGRMGQQIGEYCAGYALSWLQKMALRRAQEEARDWDRERAAPAYLFETQVAIIGTGSIGHGVAGAFKGLQAPVLGLSRTGRAVEGFDEVMRLADLSADAGAKIVVGALPFTPQTDSAIGADFFDKLDGALFINVGRGATLDEDALKAALDRGKVDHAVLDVFRDEPLDPGHWFWSDERVTVTPHVSGLTLPRDGQARLVELLERRLKGEAIEADVDVARGY
ncbi:MAG TPA: D-2-hydroxyacid dehydrogenase [Henriciella marina]|uniref:NAD(P)-dependent oxidoreductase n=1 Tax=Henriciella sp. TaxID=1968823 RepID=UPI0018571ED7|nr:NAD(P)-dependent oxidoreductase [Henriciella sp.]HIG21905.1 D-2-hydroxyacid dehydrogenase [Henriciella sp.]HIK64181.1 D-2-hydroxyacid dehydrogenase [Henriciella marina]